MKKAFQFILILGFYFICNNANAGIGETDENGWTILTPSSNTRIFYVDATKGDNATAQYYDTSTITDVRNPGEINAYKTINAAVDDARDGYPDWILLKRGEVWTNVSLGRFKSGESAEAPIVLGYYGTEGERPLIKNISNFIDHNGRMRSNFVLQGLHIYNYTHDPNSPDFSAAQSGKTLRFVGSGENILIEDCNLDFNEIVVQGYQGKYYNVSLRRSIITDNYYKYSANDNNSRPSGIYTSEVHGLLVEECVFDHNGWNEDIPDAAANMYNHNLYLQYSCSGVKVKNCIISKGAANGLQLRCCGIAEENLFIQNAVALNLGYHAHESEYDTIAIAKNNVILEGRHMDPEGVTGNLSTGAVWGIWTSYERFLVENNIIANKVASNNGSAFPNDHGAITDYVNNFVYQWDNNRNMNDPNWIDPERSVGSYHGTLGKTATLDAFLYEVRNRPLGEWPEEYEARTVNNYIREGFSYAGNSNPTVSFTSLGSDSGYAPVEVSFTSEASDPDGDNLSYIWKFEDRFFYNNGTSRLVDYDFSKSANPEYTYTYPGTLRITLTVYDGKGGSSTFVDSVTITGNYPPVASITADVTSGEAPLIVNFDASGTHDENGDELNYHYDFGDGTVLMNKDNTVSHVFAPGTYEVSFLAEDGTKSSYEKTISIVVSNPTTEFNNYEIEADALLNAEYPDFNFGTLDNSRIDINTWHGIFKIAYPNIEDEIITAKLYIASKYGSNACELKYIGDDSWGETTVTWNNQPESSDVIGTAVFENSWGIFDITETVKNEEDDTISVLLYETVAGWQEYRYRETYYAVPYLEVETKIATLNSSPVANISAVGAGAGEPMTFIFSGEGSNDDDGDPLIFTWDFGDGSGTVQGENAEHTYEHVGNYLATLIVDDGKGEESGSKSFTTVLINAGFELNAEKLSTQKINIFPNPISNGRLNYILENDNQEISILNVSGNVIYKSNKTSRSGNIDVSSLKSGLYIFVAKTPEKIGVKRFVVR